MQRVWACIFHNLALTLAVSAGALGDYINGNPSRPGPAMEGETLPVTGVFTAPPPWLQEGGQLLGKGWPGSMGWRCKPTPLACKVSQPSRADAAQEGQGKLGARATGHAAGCLRFLAQK